MDEITLFAGLKPSPPEDLAGLRAHTRVRLDSMLAGPDRSFRHGHRHGRRVRLAAAAAIVAAAAGAAALTTALLPSGAGGHSQPGPAPARAEWVVQRQPSGDFTVTLHELGNPAALQRALRAHGISATSEPYPVPGGFAFDINPAGIPHGRR